MLTAVAALLVVGGLVLLLNVGGAANFVIRHLTSKNLGTLAPGYAASRNGFRVYAILILSIGVATAGLAVGPAAPVPGVGLLAVGAGGFVIATVVAIVGEARTFKELNSK